MVFNSVIKIKIEIVFIVLIYHCILWNKNMFHRRFFNFCAKLPFQINFIEISNFPLLLCFTREMLKFKINVYILA